MKSVKFIMLNKKTEVVVIVKKYSPKIDSSNIILSNQLIAIKHEIIFKSITHILHKLGVPSHIKGYIYLREAIHLTYNSEHHTTNKLYSLLANQFATNIASVERSMRHAIELSSNRADLTLMDEIFGHSIHFSKAKPTNLEFIITVADKLKLDEQE